MDIIRWRRSRSSRWRPTAPPSIKAESRSKVRKGTLASILRKSRPGVRPNEHLEHSEGDVVFRHACKMGLEGIVSKRLGSRYKSGRSPDWLKFKNPEAPAVKRESEEDWAK
jgi:bifunctional non-homologous end joining protein LigD